LVPNGSIVETVYATLPVVSIEGLESVSTGDPFGTNTGHRRQVFRWNPATGSGTQVTTYEEGVESVSVSSDGAWLAFVSNADLLGTNHDESPELYVMQSDGTGLAQLTSASLLPRPAPRGVTQAVLSGSGNRIVFTGGINPLGTNPTLSMAVFVIDRGGTNLKQLDINLGDQDAGDVIDISDDGSKVVYEKANALRGINADGTGLHTFPSSTSLREVSISGDGSRVVWAIGVSSNASSLRSSTFVQPGTVVSLGGGHQPSITDDGTLVTYHWYTASPGIYRINSTGGPATLVYSGSFEALRASGDGTRLVGRNLAGTLALDNAGGSVQQLTQAPFGYAVELLGALSPDGNRAWYYGGGTAGSLTLALFAYDFATGTRTQLTASGLHIHDGYFRASDTGDVVFVSTDSPTGQNPGGCEMVFKLDVTGTVSQLTFCPTLTATMAPIIRGDGQEIVFWAEAQGSGNIYLYRMNGDGSGLSQVIEGYGSSTAISEGTPAWVAYSLASSGILYRVKTDGTGLYRITMSNDFCDGVSISADGNRIAFVSTGDFAGQNTDHSYEAFVYDATSQLFTQLTHDLDWVFETRISRDGQWVFTRDRRIAVDTGVAEPTAGFLHAASFVYQTVPNATGTAWAFNGRDVIDRSPNDLSLYRASTTIAPTIEVGKVSPTVVTWDPSPGSLRYDVVRGSIANLSVAGSTVDLGIVSCLEDDSPDNHTRGSEDALDPAPGEALFFLYRGSVGFNAAAGSYGQGTGGRERVAGAGACNP
jgi:Tol biopolymer transport system component